MMKTYLRLLSVLVMASLAMLAGVPAMAGEYPAPRLWEHNTPGVDRMPFVYGDTLCYVRDYDIYCSVWDNAARAWSEPKPVPGPINTGANEIWPCLTGGGKVLYFARYDPISDYDFYRSEWDEAAKAWGEPVLIEELSTDTQEWAIWVNEDETVAYVTTKANYGEGKTLGNRDIWKSVRNDKSAEWSIPVNIGAPINTEGNEWSVFADADGRIYIDGARAVTVGKSDLYVAENEQTEPGNLGAPINSEADEREFSITDKFLFLSAGKRADGVGGYDIWYLVLDNEK